MLTGKIKNILKLLIPPIVLFAYRQLFKNKPCYFGVYSKFNEVEYEDPWSSASWVSLQYSKLSKIRSSKHPIFPEPHLGKYLVVPCLLINLLSKKNTVNVLDHCGGTGVTFHTIFPYLFFPKNVNWSVLDDNPTLTEIGRKYLKNLNHTSSNNMKLEFLTNLSDAKSKFDIIYVNTSVQYYINYQKTIEDLMEFQPQYFIFTRLLSGEGKTFICSQTLHGKKTPCRFVNFIEFCEFFKKNGYELMFKSPFEDEIPKFKDVPKQYEIPFSINLVFGKKVL